MKHIALFNEACGLVFTRLYESFPLPLDFDQREFGFYDRYDMSDAAEIRRSVLTATLGFLKTEGFIDFQYYSDKPTNGVCNARLTAKGLMKLQRIPDGLKQDAKPLIEQLADASRSVSEKTSGVAPSSAVRQIIALILG